MDGLGMNNYVPHHYVAFWLSLVWTAVHQLKTPRSQVSGLMLSSQRSILASWRNHYVMLQQCGTLILASSPWNV